MYPRYKKGIETLYDFPLVPLSLRAFYKVLIDLSIYVKGYSVGFRGGEPL